MRTAQVAEFFEYCRSCRPVTGEDRHLGPTDLHQRLGRRKRDERQHLRTELGRVAADLRQHAAAGVVLGGSRLGRIGLVATLAALLGFAVVEPAARYGSTVGEIVHPIVVPMAALGMTAVGTAVLQVGIWRGWVRVTPPLCGVVPLAIELPAVIVFGPNAVVIALTWVTWVLLGLAQLSTAIGSRRRAGQPA